MKIEKLWQPFIPEDSTTWPDFDEEVIVTIGDDLDFAWLSHTAYTYQMCWDSNEWSDEPLDCVTAWMPKPKPYK